MQHPKSQLEASVHHAGDACQAMFRDLGLERSKVQELESRLKELYPAISLLLLLQRLTPDGQQTGCVDEECRRMSCQLYEENQHQQELIGCLQSTLHTHEQTVQELKATPAQTTRSEPDHFNNERPSVSSSEGSCVHIITEKPSSL
jgi:small-conductance mechanosensitive channel